MEQEVRGFERDYLSDLANEINEYAGQYGYIIEDVKYQLYKHDLHGVKYTALVTFKDK